MAHSSRQSRLIRRLLLLLFLILLSHQLLSSPTFSSLESNETTQEVINKRNIGNHADLTNLNEFAVFIFSGINISSQRIPHQRHTFLRHLPDENWIILGDSDRYVVDDTHKMRNVIKEFYPRVNPWELHSPEVGNKIGFKQPEKEDDEFRLPTVFNDDWHLNAFKFLPSLVLAKRMLIDNPKLEWFLLMDDDTYPLLPNLKQVVKERGYDADDEWYLGNAYRFVGCDEHNNNETPKDKKPLMGNVGAGVLLSRGTIRKISEWEVGKCTQKFKDCWAGSVRIALCLADLGIYLGWKSENGESQPKIHNAPECFKLFFRAEPPVDPTDEKSFGQFWPDPCQLPLSFHHMTPKGMKRIFQAEMQSLQDGNEGKVNFEGVWNAIFSKEYQVKMINQAQHLNGYDFPGSDIEFKQVKSREECIELCKRNVKCQSASMIVNDEGGGGCNLKRGIPRVDKKKEKAWSWINVENYKCIEGDK